MQAATNAGLARATGLGPALVINTVVVLLGAIGLWATTGARTTFFPADTSWTLYVGGLFGFVIIASLASIASSRPLAAHGGTISYETPVTRLVRAGDRVAWVETPRGPFAADLSSPTSTPPARSP